VNMNKEEIETCIYEIQDELRAQKKQIDALEGDLKLLIKHSTTAQQVIIAKARQVDTKGFDLFDVHMCREFLGKYSISV
jgi:hypothetical protein